MSQSSYKSATPPTAKNALTAASGSSFYYAFLFLPRERRQAIGAFYAFCRAVDDVVDEVSDPQVAHSKLNWWSQEVQRSFEGQAQHPITQALQPHITRFGLESAPLQAVIDGCRMDLTQNRYLDYPALAQYCHQVASVVGEVAAKIFGQTDAQTTAYAHQLGLALQLTNIIRDVGEDAQRGRIYLPVNELQRFDVKAQDILQQRDSTAFQSLMLFQAERAHGLYDQALALLPAVDRRAQKPGLMMAKIYRALLSEIERDGFSVLNQRVSLTPLRKFWLAWQVQAFGR
jgi:15-cis-phytoene synthase